MRPRTQRKRQASHGGGEQRVADDTDTAATVARQRRGEALQGDEHGDGVPHGAACTGTWQHGGQRHVTQR
jgi:hypothetical protein